MICILLYTASFAQCDVVSCVSNSFPVLFGVQLCEYTATLFLHILDGHLCCFQFGNVNKAAMNIKVHIFVRYMILFSLNN